MLRVALTAQPYNSTMRRLSYFGLAGGLLHLLILGYTVHLVLGRSAMDWPMYWMLFLALDFPVSLGVLPVNWLAPPAARGPLSDLSLIHI